jgi:Cu-Zn family superoxide dismutase
MRKLMMRKSIALTGLAAAVTIAACSAPNPSMSTAEAKSHKQGEMHGPQKAVAVMMPTEGNEASGTVRFMQQGDQVVIKGRFTGLEPGSTHGFHIHQYGNITKADGTAAGGHYNPEGHDHGLPPDTPRHAGDLGNVTANSDGVAKFTKKVSNITVSGHKNAILGRGVILHAKKDDGGQPTGNAGARLAQGVIGIASE